MTARLRPIHTYSSVTFKHYQQIMWRYRVTDSVAQ